MIRNNKICILDYAGNVDSVFNMISLFVDDVVIPK